MAMEKRGNMLCAVAFILKDGREGGSERGGGKRGEEVRQNKSEICIWLGGWLEGATERKVPSVK